MAKQIRSTLKGYFETGKKPTENNYIDLIDSHIILDSENTGSLNLQGNTALGDSSVHTHTFTGHITASGNISSSEDIISRDVYIEDNIYHIGDTNTRLNFQNNDEFRIIIAGSEKIHFNTSRVRIQNASLLVNNDITSTGNTTFGDDGSETHTFTGAITSSHAISSSGIITADQFVGDGSLITNITSSLVNITAVTASLATGSLFLTGSSTYASASTSDILLGLETTGSILPGSDGESDLGSPTKYWKDLFVSRSHAETFVGTFEGAISGAGQISGLGFLNNNTSIAALDVGIVSSSAQIASEISGSLSATSVAALNASILSSSAQLPAGTITSSNSTATFKVSGSQHYTSGSTSVLLGAEVTGSILPGVSSDGTTGFDLGSPTAVWRDVFVSENSLKFVSSSGLISRFEQADVEDLRAGRPIKQAAKSVDAAGEEPSVDGLTNYIRPQAIYHPTDDETVILLNTAGKLLYRTPGGDPFTIRSNGLGFADIKLGSTTTADDPNAHTGAIGFGTAVRIPGHISASNDKTEHHIAGAVKIYSGSNQVWLFGSGSATQQGGISASGTIIANKLEADSLISHAGDANTGLQFASDTVQIEGNDVTLAQFNTTRINLNKQITGSGGMLLSGELESSNIITGPITASGGISASGNLHVGDTISMSPSGRPTSASISSNNDRLVLNFASEYNKVQLNRSELFAKPVEIFGSITASGDISSSGALKIQGGTAAAGQENYITAADGGAEVQVAIGTKTGAVLGLTVEGAISASGEIKSTTSASFSSRITAAESELGNTLLSSSAQLASDISGSFTAASASFSTRVAANEVITAKTLVSSSAQLASDISGSFTAASASFSTRVAANEVITAKTLLSSSAQIASNVSGALSTTAIAALGGGYISSSLQNLGNITGSIISASGEILADQVNIDGKLSLNTDGTTGRVFSDGISAITGIQIGRQGTSNKNIELLGPVTASGDISASGTITAEHFHSTDDVVIDDNLTVSGIATLTTASIGDVSSSLIPDIDNTYDLGSSTKEWRNLHLDGTANIDLGLIDSASIGKVSSSLLPDASNTYDLGSSTLQWKDLHVDGTAHIDTIGETVAITTASVGDVSSSLIPDANNVFDLGSTTKIWGTVHANVGSFNSITTSGSSILTLQSSSISYLSGSSDITVGASMVPDLNVTHNLGSSTFQWNILHASTSSVDLSTPATASISVVSSSLLPFIESGSDFSYAYELGTETQQWSSSYIHTAYITNLGSPTDKTNDIHVSTSSLGVISSSLNPDADDTYDLGSSTLKWKDLYIDGTAYIDNINYINGGAVTASGDISGSGNLFVEGSASFGNIKQLTNTLLAGNITASNGSPFISGSGTEFTNLNVGDAIKITSASVSQFFTIADIGSNHSMSLDSNWTGGNVTGSHIAHIDPANLLVVKNGDDATRISIDRSGNLSSSNSATASFGYYIGDGTNLTGVTADWDGTRNGDAEITGSLVISGSGTPSLNVLGEITSSGTIKAEHFHSTDDVQIDDDLTVGGIATLDSASIGKVSSSLLPDTDDTYDLGSTALQWKDLHLDGTANIDTLAADTSTVTTSTIITASLSNISSSLIPDTDDTYDLGSSTKEWKDLYLDGTANIDFTSTDSASIGKVSSSLLPDGDDHHSLGSSTLQWKDLYIDGTANIDLGLVDSASIGVVSSSLNPDADNTYDLGSSTLQWKDLHLNGTANIDLGLVDSASIGKVSSSLLPDASNAYDLGSTALQWKDLHLDGTANIDLGLIDSASIGIVSSSLTPDANNTYDLGTSTSQWKDLYVDGVAYIDTIGETVAITTASMGKVSSSLLPDANNIYDLGSTALKWKNISATSASITKLSVEAFGEITASGNISSSATVTALSGSFSNLSVSAFGNISSTGNIIASNNISSSGTVTGLSGSFSELNGNSPLTINAATTFTSPITSSAIISSSTNIISPNINALTDATSSYTLNSATSSLTLASTFNAFTASANITTGSNTFSGSQVVTGSMLITGSLTVSGSGTLTNIGPFTNTGAITQNGDSIFSGSLELSGSDNHITASGNISASGNIIANAGTFTTLNTGQGNYELYNMNQNVTTTSDVVFNRVTASIDLKVDGNSILGNAAGDTHTITGKTSFTGPITASTHISSSVTSTASFGRVEATTFSGDGSSLTGITADWDGTHNGDAQITGSLTISGSGTPSLNVLGNITASGLISSSGAGTFGGDVTLGPAGEGYRFLASTDTDQNIATFTDIASTNAGMTIVNDAVYLINGGNAKLTLSGSRFGIGTQTPGESLEIKAYTDGAQNTTGNVRAEGHISASSFISETHITASGNISSSDTITALSGSFSNLSVSSFGQITASGDISSSATVTALSGSFTHITVGTFGNITSSANISASGTITAEHFHSSDDVQIDDDLTVSGTSIMTTASIGDMSSSLIPDANNVFDLGSTTKKWRNVFVDGTGSFDDVHTGLLKVTQVSSSLLPPSTFSGNEAQFNLGAVNQQWKDLYIDGTANIDLGLIDSASIGKISSSLLPDADDTYDLGSSALKWKDLYVDGVTNTDSASIGKVSSSLTPDASDIYDLGTTSLKWKDINAVSASIDRFANIFSFTHITASSNISASGTITGLSGSFTNLSVGSFGNITASGNISASATSTGSFGTINVDTFTNVNTTHVTASGNISSSGTVTGLSGSFSHILGNSPITVQDTITFQSHVTASNNISSSATITANELVISSNITASGNISASGNIFSNGLIGSNGSTTLGNSSDDTHTFTGNITASSNISASGIITAEGLLISDDATITDDLTVSGIATVDSASIGKVSSSLTPDADDTYDLGTSDLQWKDLYVDGVANIDFTTTTTASISKVSSSLLPDGDDHHDLGSSTLQWKDLYVDGTANLDTVSASATHINAASATASLHTSGAFSDVIFRNLPITKPTVTGSLWLSGSAGQDSKYLVVFTG